MHARKLCQDQLGFNDGTHSVHAPTFYDISDYYWILNGINADIRIHSKLRIRCLLYSAPLVDWNVLKYTYVGILGENVIAVAIKKQAFCELKSFFKQWIPFPCADKTIHGQRYVIVAVSIKNITPRLSTSEQMTLYCNVPIHHMQRSILRIRKLLGAGVFGKPFISGICIVGLDSKKEVECFLSEKFGEKELSDVEKIEIVRVIHYLPRIMIGFTPYKVSPDTKAAIVTFSSYGSAVQLVKESPILWNSRVLHIRHKSQSQSTTASMPTRRMHKQCCASPSLVCDIKSGDTDVCTNCGVVVGLSRTACPSTWVTNYENEKNNEQHGTIYDARFSHCWNMTCHKYSQYAGGKFILDQYKDHGDDIALRTKDIQKQQAFQLFHSLAVRFNIHIRYIEYAKTLYAFIRDTVQRIHDQNATAIACVAIALEKRRVRQIHKYECTEHFLLHTLSTNKLSNPFKPHLWKQTNAVPSEETVLNINTPRNGTVIHIQGIPYVVQPSNAVDKWHLKQLFSHDSYHLLFNVTKAVFSTPITSAPLCVSFIVEESTACNRERTSRPVYSRLAHIRTHNTVRWRQRLRIAVKNPNMLHIHVLQKYKGRRITVGKCQLPLTKQTLACGGSIRLDIISNGNNIGIIELKAWTPSIRRIEGCLRSFECLYDKRIHCTQCKCLHT